MRHWVITLISCYITLAFPAYAQNMLTLKGRVLVNESPATGATISLKKNKSIGTIADLNGRFQLKIESSLVMADTLVISSLESITKEYPLARLNFSDSLILNLAGGIRTLKDVNIIAKTSIAEEMSQLRLNKYDIYQDPSSAGDVLRMISNTPYATNTDESASPSLRGSSAERTSVLLNGVPVKRPVRNTQLNNIGNFSLFNTEIIEKEIVYPSNPPIIYSNTSGGAIELETLKKIEQNELQVSLGLANIGFLGSQHLGRKDNFIQLYSNYQPSAPFRTVNRKSTKELHDFSSVDGGMHIHISPGKRSYLSLFSYGISEGYKAQSSSYAYLDTATSNRRRNFNILTFRHLWGSNKVLYINNGTDFSRSQFRFGNINYNEENKTVYSAISFKHTINPVFSYQGGFNHTFSRSALYGTTSANFFNLVSDTAVTKLDAQLDNNIAEAFVYAKFNISTKFLVGAGVRKNLPLGQQTSYWSGQLNLKYDFNKDNSLLFSIGKYYSYNAPNYLRETFQLAPSKQVAVEYKWLKRKIELQAAVYAKQERGDILEMKGGSDNWYRNILGAELQAKTRLGKHVEAQLSYVFLRSKAHVDDLIYDESNSMNYLVRGLFSYQNYRILNFSLNFTCRPGTLYNKVIGASFNHLEDIYEPLFSEEVNNTRFGNYQSISLSASKVIGFKKNSLIIYSTLTNIFDRLNPMVDYYNRNYSEQSFQYFQRRLFYVGLIWRIGGRDIDNNEESSF